MRTSSQATTCTAAPSRLFDKVRTRSAGHRFSFVDLSDPQALRAAIRPETKMVWVETPSNPMLKLTDLEAIARIAHEHGLIAAADNTFASPYVQRPLELGFDVVVHSSTKYLNGHSDVIGGVAVVGQRAEASGQAERLGFLQNSVGAIAGPFDSFLTLRGVKTPGPAHAAPFGERLRAGRVAGTPPQGGPRALPRPRIPPAARAGQTPDAGLRRHGVGGR